MDENVTKQNPEKFKKAARQKSSIPLWEDKGGSRDLLKAGKQDGVLSDPSERKTLVTENIHAGEWTKTWHKDEKFH